MRVWQPTGLAEITSFQFIRRLCIKALTRSVVEENPPCPVLATTCTCRGDTLILSCVCNTHTPHEQCTHKRKMNHHLRLVGT